MKILKIIKSIIFTLFVLEKIKFEEKCKKITYV